MFRSPESGVALQETPGFHLPKPLDFSELKSREGSADSSGEIHAYSRVVRDKALEVTSLGSAGLGWQMVKAANGIQCEGLPIAGSKIKGIRHIAEFCLPADVVLDAYVRLNYTDIIDKYTTHVESVESIPPAEFAWMQVVWTYDRIFPVGSSRDFCTFDFVDKENFMLVSKSVDHPALPKTSLPGWASIFSGSLKSPTYRVPLFYALRVVPNPEDAGRCKVIQFQWSDVAGIVPANEIWKSVSNFGFDSIPKFRAQLESAIARGVVLGKESGAGFLVDPLVPRWRQQVAECLADCPLRDGGSSQQPEQNGGGRGIPPAAMKLAVVAPLAAFFYLSGGIGDR